MQQRTSKVATGSSTPASLRDMSRSTLSAPGAIDGIAGSRAMIISSGLVPDSMSGLHELVLTTGTLIWEVSIYYSILAIGMSGGC